MDTKTKLNIGHIATILMALLFIGSGIMKLIGGAEVAKQFAAWGYPSWFHTVIGGLEVAGAIGLFIPKLRALAIYGLIGLMVGAIYTHVVKEGMPANSIGAIVAIMLGFLILKTVDGRR